MSKKSTSTLTAKQASEIRELIASSIAEALEEREEVETDEDEEEDEEVEEDEDDEEEEAEKPAALSVTAKINGTKVTVTNKTINEMRAKRDELLALKKPSAKQKAKLEEIADTLFKMRRIYHKNLKARRSA